LTAAQKHFLTLDGLRGVAAIAVLLFHRRLWAPGGHFLDHAYLAVDFFFALSGFVIAHAYRERLVNGMSFKRFATFRFIRLYPLLFLGCIIGIGFLTGRYVSKGQGFNLEFLLAAVCGLLTIPTFLPVPLAYMPFPTNGPSWSLFFELIVNALYASCARWLTRGVVVFILFASFIWLAVCAVEFGGLGRLGHEFPTLLGGAPRTLFSFFAGTAVYAIHKRTPHVALPYPTILLGCLLIAIFSPNRDAVNSIYYDLACVAFVFPCIVLLGAMSGDSQNGSARLLGELSYPIYILHVPLLYWFEETANRLNTPLNFPALVSAAAFCVAFAALAWKFFDQPVRKLLSARIPDRSDRAKAGGAGATFSASPAISRNGRKATA
jgi:peptidoglycan/LPS O-acetylase OafA/YrhL